MKLPKSIDTIPATTSFGREGPSTKHLKAIGKIVVASARLENTLGICISLLSDSLVGWVESTGRNPPKTISKSAQYA